MVRHEGASKVEGKVVCDKCGADLTIPGNAIFVGHGDSPKEYYNIYNCTSCQRVVTQTFQRSAEDAAYWE